LALNIASNCFFKLLAILLIDLTTI
jgi:hypothetical protein